MKILFMFPSVGRGGAEEYSLKIASEAVKRHWEVHAAFSDCPQLDALKNDFESLGVTYHPLTISDEARGRFVNELIRFIRMAKLIMTLKPDRAHVTLPWPDMGTGPLAALSLLKVPTLVVFQLSPWVVQMSGWARSLRGWAMGRNQKWVSASQQNRKMIAKTFAVSENSIEVIYNSTKIVNVEPDFQEVCRKKLRDELGLSDNSIIILTVGRLDEQKGYRYLLEAVNHIYEHHREVFFVWAGDGPLKASLEQSLNESGLQHNVFLLGNRVDIVELLLASDLFALSSTHEGGAPPFAVMEAVSCKLPFVVSEATNTEETFANGEDGLICKTKDSLSLADKLNWAIENLGEMRRMAENAYGKFLKHTEGDMAQKTLELVEKIKAK